MLEELTEELEDPLSTKFITNINEIFKKAKVSPSIKDLEAAEKFPARTTEYYLKLAKSVGTPLLKQLLPSEKELIISDDEAIDSLNEDEQSPSKCIVHRYPDRCLFLISNDCAMYCRFCTRKRRVCNKENDYSLSDIMSGLDYIKNTPEIRDVIISGGDPLMCSNEKLEWILKSLRNISHAEIIRIGTRIPCVFPQRINEKLCNMLKQFHPLFMNVHFAHPSEITEESSRALNLLADAGIQLGNQCVLLKEVNDNPLIMRELNQKLLKNRVRPYIIYQMDKIQGGGHFKTSIQTGLDIIKDGLRGWTSGLAVPHYIIDAPNGKGKCPLLPEYCKVNEDGTVNLTNYKNEESLY